MKTILNKDYAQFDFITPRVVNHSIYSTQDTKVTSVSLMKLSVATVTSKIIDLSIT